MANFKHVKVNEPIQTRHPASTIIKILLVSIFTFLTYEVQNICGARMKFGITEYNLCSVLWRYEQCIFCVHKPQRSS